MKISTIIHFASHHAWYTPEEWGACTREGESYFLCDVVYNLKEAGYITAKDEQRVSGFIQERLDYKFCLRYYLDARAMSDAKYAKAARKFWAALVEELQSKGK